MLSVVKTDERRQAREMRAEGCSVKEIAATLGIARSSASIWVRDVPLGPGAARRPRLPQPACVHSTRIVQMIYGSIQEYGGFERPEWLD
jgi:transposase-like protein